MRGQPACGAPTRWDPAPHPLEPRCRLRSSRGGRCSPRSTGVGRTESLSRPGICPGKTPREEWQPLHSVPASICLLLSCACTRPGSAPPQRLFRKRKRGLVAQEALRWLHGVGSAENTRPARDFTSLVAPEAMWTGAWVSLLHHVLLCSRPSPGARSCSPHFTATP